jgi:hypothetical protein
MARVTSGSLWQPTVQTLVPAAVGSTVLLVINAALLRYVFHFDRDVRGE